MANGDDQDLCGYPAQKGPCGNPATGDDGYCWLDTHSDDPDAPDTEGDGRGAPEGNQHALGNPGGEGPPEGNVRAMKHGLHMTAERLLEAMDERQQEEFKHRFVEFRDKCLNDSRAMLLAARAVIETSLMEETLEGIQEEGFTRTVYTDDGDEYEQFKGDDIQALNALGREIRLGLHYEGNSAQHTGGGSSQHDNLDQLVNTDAD